MAYLHLARRLTISLFGSCLVLVVDDAQLLKAGAQWCPGNNPAPPAFTA